MSPTPPLLELSHVGRDFVVSASRGARTVAAPIGWSAQLAAWLRGPRAIVQAVEDVSFSIGPGEAVGLVGESGCGKSTLGRLAAGLLPPTRGRVRVMGRDPAADATARLSAQMIFQNPMASLNPRMRIDRIVGEAPQAHGLVDAAGSEAWVARQLQRAGLDPALRTRFAHQLSGGQRQRVGIARALAVQPSLLIADEALASLDVSIQAQVFNLFMDLKRDDGLSLLFISHDLSMVLHGCERVLVMYLGRIVEDAPAAALANDALHPYTQALLAERPNLSQRKRRFVGLAGELPSPLDPPSGCAFHPRCPHAMPRCRSESPPLVNVGDERRVACHLHPAPI